MKPRILIISQHFPPDRSGNASRIHDISKNLVKLGCKVIVFSPFPSFPHGNFPKKIKITEKKNVDGIEHRSLFCWQPSKRDPGFISRISFYLSFPIHAIFWSFIYRKKYDIVISSSPPIFTGITGIFIKKILNKKFVYDVRDLWLEASISLGFITKKGFLVSLSKKYEGYIYKLSDLIIVTTNEIKKVITKIYKINSGKIHLIPNGVDTNIFTSSNNKENRIIYTGNIGHAQDIEKVILAVKKINESFPLKFYLVGDGDINQYLQKLVKEESIENKIIFKGLVDREQIPRLISESLIGVAPLKKLISLKYALPTKIYEYMSCGIPFIATGTGEIEHIAKESRAGIIANNSINSIYENILNLIKNEDLIKEMGMQGQIYTKKYCDRRKITEKLLSLLNGL
jgi:glycosyltransferase involved in cell wall biosynthesis